MSVEEEVKQLREQGLTYKAIGDKLGFTRQRAQQICAKLGLTHKRIYEDDSFFHRNPKKQFLLGEQEQKWLKEDQTLIFGNEVPEYVVMSYAKYARLVSETDPNLITKRLTILPVKGGEQDGTET